MSMKKKIIVIILTTVAFLLFVMFLSVKDALWFESMMVNKMLAERYPDQKASAVQRLGEYALLFEKGEEAAKQLEWANTVWNATDSAPEDYQKAAEIIVTNLGINKEEWLTLGNVIKYFGIPGNIEGLFPKTDADGNVLVIPYDFNIYYEDKKIRFDFSLSGFIESVMLVTHDGHGATGISKLYWPHDYNYAKNFPIYAGFKYDKQTNKFILKKMRQYILDSIDKGGFFANIEVLTPQEKELIDIKNMKIYMIDGINEDLAKVYFEFSTKDMTVCYGPCFFVSELLMLNNSSSDLSEKAIEKPEAKETTPEKERLKRYEKIRELFYSK